MLLSGSAVARAFGERIVTVTSTNKDLYRSAQYGGGTAGNPHRRKLLFDGSGGGEMCMKMKLEVNPGLIGGFELPSGVDHPEVDFRVELIISEDGCTFWDGINTFHDQFR
jgi:hypothetical protein